MEERKTSGRYWRIGELAEATGLTVRTLHHYEHIGLLAPAERTEGHQRLYDERDVRRLYRIRALRDLGLSLAESRITRRIHARTTKGLAPGDAEARWRELANELRACMEAGEAPSGPRARAAARSAQERLRAFAGDEPETLEALSCLRRLAPPENLAGWDPALMRYLDQALATLHETEDEPC